MLRSKLVLSLKKSVPSAHWRLLISPLEISNANKGAIKIEQRAVGSTGAGAGSKGECVPRVHRQRRRLSLSLAHAAHTHSLAGERAARILRANDFPWGPASKQAGVRARVCRMVWRSLLAAAAAERLNLAHSGASAGGRRRREGRRRPLSSKSTLASGAAVGSGVR